MRCFPKIHCVDAHEIKVITPQRDNILLEAESGKTFLMSKAKLNLEPKAHDYLVIDEDGRESLMSKEEFELKYQQIEEPMSPVCLEDIQDKIVRESFGSEGNMVVCFLSFDNGFKTSGHSFCMLDDEFDEGLGQSVAYRNATEKLWEIEGYHRMQKAYEVINASIVFERKRESND